jgi:hypothetical protein
VIIAKGREGVFHENRFFRLGPRHQWKEKVREEAEVNMFLENPFPIQRIIRLEQIKESIEFVSGLPDELEPVTLPLFHVNILHPEMAAEFLTHSEEVTGCKIFT